MGREVHEGRAPPPDPVDKDVLADIRWTDMEEKVGWYHGRYTVVNILKPSLRIERTPRHKNRDPSIKKREAFYRVILCFKLQVDIAGFDDGGVSQACNRFFDNISLRYLFNSGERHKFDPNADPIQAGLTVTNEESHGKSLDYGLTGVTPSTITPKLEAHLTSEGRVTVEQPGQKSWRSGLSFEPYQPPDWHPSHHDHRHHHNDDEHPHHHHSYSSGDLIISSPIIITAKRPHPKHFTIKSHHSKTCKCPKIKSPQCHLQETGIVSYNKAAHWSWQARADLDLWGPENYESMTQSITVVRYICVDEVDPYIDHTKPGLPEGEIHDKIRPFLHFDFLLESRLRELDHGWNGFKNAFRRLPKPPEERRKKDVGLPLRADKVAFCVSPCYEMVYWPPRKTRNTEREKWQIARGEIKTTDMKLLSNDAYAKYKVQQKKEKDKKDGNHGKDTKDRKDRSSTGNNRDGNAASETGGEGIPVDAKGMVAVLVVSAQVVVVVVVMVRIIIVVGVAREALAA
ncbi:hypothetical protein QBC37DRAFT_386979 [Rhypophila decipiens]|uniref:Uncharacterized protein n=1 Tax=Rhypophila decipiens TaxID=261697 RepID=A0AAN6Y8N7_9PEZI|nr:hypothetical protein QBC37DRAFT_386979 [Rhypophila decipiens]